MAVVLITGGSSGIGLATVRRLAAAGDRVFSASRNPERGPVPAGVTPIVIDIGRPQAAAAAISVPVMREQGGGRIVNVTSMNDSLPAPFGGYYSASKAALASATAALDAEVYGFGIRVTMIAPGSALRILRGS
jgi:NAD(P)-dependent dehydrogenase (short-subunit alcohol dehydrogenase family)